MSYDEDLKAVKQYGCALKYVKEQTEEICLEAVKEDGFALQFAKKQTNKICLEAVKRNGLALQFVKEQTEEICLEAVKRNGSALCYVNKQTKKICLEAIKQNIHSLVYVNMKYVDDIYKYINLINFKGLHYDYNFIKIKNINALINYKWGLKYFKQNLNLCKSIITCKYHLSYVNYKKHKLCLQIIKTYNNGFQYINKQHIQNLL